jgi:hypothetical protein
VASRPGVVALHRGSVEDEAFDRDTVDDAEVHMNLAVIFAPYSEETAIFYLAAVVAFALAAFFSPIAGRFPGGSLGLIALGLGLFVWPTAWQNLDRAF